jgi:hypothetical protein
MYQLFIIAILMLIGMVFNWLAGIFVAHVHCSIWWFIITMQLAGIFDCWMTLDGLKRRKKAKEGNPIVTFILRTERPSPFRLITFMVVVHSLFVWYYLHTHYPIGPLAITLVHIFGGCTWFAGRKKRANDSV